MDARCAKCGSKAALSEDMSAVRCPHCGYEAGYDEYIQEMKEQAQGMAADYIPDRPGM